MKNSTTKMAMLVGVLLLLGAFDAFGQDWPQWRGPNRDNKVTGFVVPATWPKELKLQWKKEIGVGESSPVLVGEKLYVFTRQGAEEVISCLDAGTGKPQWEFKYPSEPVTGAAKAHPGPRSTPAVADGKICALGASGVVSCLDATTGKQIWQKKTSPLPQFFTASSPIITEGKCIVFLGSSNKGALTAYDLATGDAKWEWTGGGAPYGSPNLMTVSGTKQVVTPSAGSIDGISLADGKALWKVPFGGKAYQNTYGTPVIDGQTVFFSGSGKEGGTVALKVEKKGDGFAANQLWNSKQASGGYYTPVLKDGLLYSADPTRNFFCMDAKSGDVLWTDKTKRGQCGTILDAGPVLLALTSESELIAFKPDRKEFVELAKYKVAEGTDLAGPWAYPIIAGKRVYVKDKDSIMLWTFE